MRLVLCTILLLSPLLSYAQSSDTELEASTKSPWEELPKSEPERSWYMKALLWIPNRIADLIDVPKLDIGVGPSFGAVARVSRYGQIGFRSVSPASLRVGALGRRAPVMLESSSEFGVGPLYVNSKDRRVCAGEVGLGIDLFLFGIYGGFCVDEMVDLFSGLFLIDLKDDDL